MAQRLTDRVVRELPAPATGNRVHYDTDLPGFGARVTSAGARSFVLNYRAGGRERRLTIGSYPAWNVRAARERAGELRRQVDSGRDPLAERDATRTAPTINDLADRFESEHLPKRRPGTAEAYRTILRLHVRPNLGAMKVADVRHADVERLHQKIVGAGQPYAANRTIAVLSKMFSLAVAWELRGDNPARGVEQAPEQKRERFLSPEEIGRLGEVLAVHPERASANAVRLLLLTGARRGEVLNATWDQFDLDRGIWTKPSAVTKQRRLHRVPLGAAALALLDEMHSEAARENNRRKQDGLPKLLYLFPGEKEGKPLREIKRFWASACRKAEINGVRIHDLRHTFASILASAGLSLPIIGSLLGHSQAATTHRYAHLLDHPLRAAAEAAGEAITRASKQHRGSALPVSEHNQ